MNPHFDFVLEHASRMPPREREALVMATRRHAREAEADGQAVVYLLPDGEHHSTPAEMRLFADRLARVRFDRHAAEREGTFHVGETSVKSRYADLLVEAAKLWLLEVDVDLTSEMKQNLFSLLGRHAEEDEGAVRAAMEMADEVGLSQEERESLLTDHLQRTLRRTLRKLAGGAR